MKSDNFFAVGAMALVGALGAVLLAAGCATSSATSDDAAASAAAATGDSKLVSADVTKGGAELWAENCNRCHNSRSPSERSDAEWDVIAHHMRLQATLTGIEHRKILEFLKASN